MPIAQGSCTASVGHRPAGAPAAEQAPHAAAEEVEDGDERRAPAAAPGHELLPALAGAVVKADQIGFLRQRLRQEADLEVDRPADAALTDHAGSDKRGRVGTRQDDPQPDRTLAGEALGILAPDPEWPKRGPDSAIVTLASPSLATSIASLFSGRTSASAAAALEHGGQRRQRRQQVQEVPDHDDGEVLLLGGVGTKRYMPKSCVARMTPIRPATGQICSET